MLRDSLQNIWLICCKNINIIKNRLRNGSNLQETKDMTTEKKDYLRFSFALKDVSGQLVIYE